MTAQTIHKSHLAPILKLLLQRLPGLLMVSVFSLAMFGPVYAPYVYVSYYAFLHCLFVANSLRSSYGAYNGFVKSKAHSQTDFMRLYCDKTSTLDGNDTSHDLPYNHVVHVIILPNYKEEVETLCETLSVLASHEKALTQYKVCLAMEESEKGAIEKAQSLMKMFADAFFEVTFTLHPIDRPGEIRGKSSNVAWAAYEMARRSGGGVSGRHDHEILTVMDADTCFAEDYFSAVNYHYCVASPAQRKIMMFAPSTVFDRNAANVPVIVRTTDMFWSIGVMSNLYESSSIKLPCSAYSVSMDLAIAVNFWDAGPEAIGEDMHMYLKCFFATKGQVIVQSIYSPASQCNVEGSGSGISGYISGHYARLVQSTRHLWGTLDTGYALRKTIMHIIDPASTELVNIKHGSDDKYEKDSTQSLGLLHVLSLFHRMIEAHILTGHIFIFMVFAMFSFKMDPTTGSWMLTNGQPVHPIIAALFVFTKLTGSVILPANLLMVYFYEKYARWVSFERWAVQEVSLREKGMDENRIRSYLGDLRRTHGQFFQIPLEDQKLRVQHLGKRAQLASGRTRWNYFDWFAVPLSGLIFYLVPQIKSHMSQLFTDRLDYKVAAKPTLNKVASDSDALLASILVSDEVETKSESSRGDEGYFEEEDTQSLSRSPSIVV